MALIKCPDCGKQVSSEAPACPGCGRPIKVSEEQVESTRDVEHEYMVRRIVTYLGEANLVQMEISKWAKQGWTLHQQSQGKWSDGGPMILLTFVRPKKAGNPPVPAAPCCVVPAALFLFALVAAAMAIIRLLSA